MQHLLRAAAFFVLVMIGCRGGGAAPAPAGATAPAGAIDPSPHTSRLVTVADGIQLELLDWGGHGPPLIFLSGLGNSAHVFDDFAPAFGDRFHVYGITRRGFGASSQPSTGYDAATLGADLAGALRGLGLPRASFVGHSIASEELNWLAAHEPARVEKLVYLDAAYDRIAVREAMKKKPQAPEIPVGPPADPDKVSIAAFGAYVERTYGVPMSEAELRANIVFDASGRYVRDRTPDTIKKAIVDGVAPPDYAHIAAPALAVYRVDESAEGWWPKEAWRALSEADREKVKVQFVYLQSVFAKERDRFRREVGHGQVVEITGAHHYVFLSHRAVVLEKMRAFLGP